MLPRWLKRRRRRPEGSGTCDYAYHVGRRSNRALSYRLGRRTREVALTVRRHCVHTPRAILDIGTADAYMLADLQREFDSRFAVGIDLSRELLAAADPGAAVDLACADAAHVPFRAASFDLVIATAVIEHVPRPIELLREARRCLRPGGLLVLTCPDPFWEHVATLVGHLPDEQHHDVMDIPRLSALCERAALKVVERRKFMLSPVGLPYEAAVEGAVHYLGAEFLFANQLVAAMRPPR